MTLALHSRDPRTPLVECSRAGCTTNAAKKGPWVPRAFATHTPKLSLMGGIIFVIAVAIFALRVSAISQAQQRAARQVPGAAKTSPGMSFMPTMVVTVKAHVLLLRRHLAGEKPTPEQLLKARRLKEASRAIAPGDHNARWRLALRRSGPIPDLLIVARRRGGRGRDESRAMLIQLYPGERWGFPNVTAHSLGDLLVSAYNTLSDRSSLLQLGTASRLARRIIWAYPEADTYSQTALQLACIDVLRGRGESAKELSVGIANSDAPPYVRAQASRISQRISATIRDASPLAPVRIKNPRNAATVMSQVLRKSGMPWPVSPHDLHQLVGSPTRQVTDRDLTPDALAACLTAQFDVWVSVVDASGTINCIPIVAVEPTVRVVMLGSGEAIEWDALIRASVWGKRMAIVHPTGAQVPGKPRATPFQELPCPRDERGVPDAGPEALTVLRAAAQQFPDDALASYLYATALTTAENSGGNEVYTPDEHRRHLAASAARFPGAAWPFLALTDRLEHDGDGQPGALLTVGLAGHMPVGAGEAQARASFDPIHADALLRDELTVSHTRHSALHEAALRAAARRDGKDFDAHLDLLGRVGPDHASLPAMQQLRELVWLGPEGAIATMKGTPSDPDATIMKLHLAAHTGNPQTLRTHGELNSEGGQLRSSRDWKVLLALHSGDYQQVLDAAQDVITTDGLSPVITDALVAAAGTLAGPDDSRLTTALSFAIAHGDREVAHLTGELQPNRRGVAIDILRAKVSKPGDAIEIHARLASALINHAAASPVEQREHLAREALASLNAIEHASSNVQLWDCFQAAAWRHIDPDRAFDILKGIEHLAHPLVPFLLAAAIATQRGEPDVASRMISRASNPEIIRDGVGWVVQFGLDHQANLAFEQADVSLVSAESWFWYAHGGLLPALPPVPYFGQNGVPQRALWRLLEDHEYDIARDAHTRHWLPQDFLQFADGAPRVAIAAVLDAANGNPSALAVALGKSRHPAYLHAVALCAKAGIDIGSVDTSVLTPAQGLAADDAAAVATTDGAAR